MDSSFLVESLKWIAAILAALGGLSALVWEPRKEDPATHRRPLSPTGWIAILIVTVGLVTFVATDLQEKNKAEQEKQALARKAEEDRKQSQADLEFKQHEIKSLERIIESQRSALSYFRHLVLILETLDGVTLSWRQSPAIWAKMRADPKIAELLKAPGDAYFRTCLLTIGMEAERTPSGRWLFRCALSRPMGVREQTFEFAPNQPQGQAFEIALDHLLSKHLSMRQINGEYVILLTPDHRPASVRFSQTEISVSVREPPIKLNRLERANVEFRMDVDRAQLGPSSITITSLDPNVRLNQRLALRWAMRQSGTAWRSSRPGEEPVPKEVYSAYSGAHELKADFSKLLFPSDQTGASSNPPAQQSENR